MNNATAPSFEVVIPDVVLTPGEPTSSVMHIRNLSDHPLNLSFALLGLEAGWYQLPQAIDELAPLATLEVTCVFTLPRGYPPASLPVTFVATEITNPSLQHRAAFTLEIGDARSVGIRLDPDEIDGRHRGHFRVIIRNRGQRPERYRLVAKVTDQSVRIHLDNPTPVVPPGQETIINGTIATKAKLSGASRRFPFSISAQGPSQPAEVTGAFVARAELGTKTAKIAVLLAVLLVWGALASIGITAFDSSLHKRAIAAQSVSNPTAQPTKAKVTPSSSTSPSSHPASTSTTPSTATSSGVTLTGTVSGLSPGGVTVTATPVSDTAPATAANLSGQPASQGVVYGNSSNTITTNTQLGSQVSTTTAPDGAFVLAGLRAGVSYLITFSKPGFTTHKILFSPTSSSRQVTLNVQLVPGTGSLGGTVTGANGPLGNAKVTVTNGLLTFTTHTSSVGNATGTWSITQISTPGSYLITASAPNYGTQVTTVTLGPSASQSNITQHLVANVGSITGVISSATTNGPLGGATVTASNGSTVYTATTFTTGEVGGYILPNLPIPANWTLTFGDQGYQTQTERVALSGNTAVSTVLSQSGGNLAGTITLPDNSPSTATTTIGLVLSNGSEVYKTLSTSRTAGSSTVSYQFPQVLPGTYTLTAEGFGFETTSKDVTLTPGATTDANLTMSSAPANGIDTATITGSVTAAVGGPLAGVPIELNGTQATTTNANGAYSINNVPPGVATITAVGTKVTTQSSNGYTTTSQQVNVPSGGTVVAPTIVLAELSSISGQLLDVTDNEPINQAPTAGCTVTSGQVDLTQNGKVISSVSVSSADDYSFTGVAPGNYVIKASAQCFIPIQIAVNVTNGQTLTQQLLLSTTPTYTITVESLAGTSGTTTTPQPVVGACVTITPKGSSTIPSSVQLTSSTGVTTFVDLSLGTTYTVTIDQYQDAPTSCADATGTPIATQSTSFTAEPNGESNDIFLNPQFATLELSRLAFPFVDSAVGGSVIDCVIGGTSNPTGCPTTVAASGVTVTLTGIDGYSASSLAGQVEQTTIQASASGDSWTFPASTLDQLISTSARLNISIAGFEPFSQTITLPTSGGGGQGSLTELLTPTPVQVSLTALTGLSAVAVQPNSIAPTNEDTLRTTTTIAINTTVNGYSWSDPATGHSSGYAEPGIYEVQGTGPGIALAPETVTVGLCSTSTTACAQSINLTNTTLTITPTNLPSGGSLTAALACQNSGSLNQLGSSVNFVNGSAEFVGLTSSSAQSVVTSDCTSGSYVYEISLNQVLTYITANQVSPTSTASGDVRSPTLTYAVGKLLGESYSGGPTTPVADTSIYLCPTGTSDCSSSSSVASGLTAANGSFLIPSVATYSSSGITNSLNDASSYAVGISGTAYTQPTYSQTVTPDGSATTITVTANPITQEVQVAYNGSASTSITVAPTTTTTGVRAATQSGAGSCSSSGSGTSCTVTFTFELAPTQWTFEITASGYTNATLGPYSYEPGSQPAEVSTSIQEVDTTVSGTVYVSANAASPSATPISGLGLTLSSTSTGSNFTSETATTTSNGTYTFATPVPAGNYEITVASSSGYIEQTPVSFATDYPNPTVDNFTVYAPASSLDITLDSPSGVSSSDLAGATVTLATPTTTTTPASCSTGDPLLAQPPSPTQTTTATATTSGSATTYSADFASVPPDVYTINVTGPNIPPQPSPLPTVTICPGETSPATTTVTVAQGGASGSVTLSANPSSAVVVTIAAAPPSSSGLASVTATCTVVTTTDSCDYQLTGLAYSMTYTITASASTYTNTTGSTTSYSFEATSTTPTQSGDDFKLTAS
ncbi:carboxypeptidase regulatory-like domain-containing protein [Ferrimicrobium sp.]|uniref:beta strand repeat-containing protein n=1 Tax=Ferrimicrobium sp. TaxID=2926050 RepID=UPI0026104931|nr:carboxypeptidase regulatory-like domain-containing protein [Ferrimicrobium sp.]